jgi:hypothetical protein
MSISLATKGVIAVTVAGGSGETVYLIEMAIDVDASPLDVVVDQQPLDVEVSIDDFDIEVDAEEEGWS